MAGFVDYNELIAELTAGKKFDWDFLKVGPAPQGVGNWCSHWIAGGSPGAGADPPGTPGSARSDAVGSMNFTAVSPETKHILTLGGVATINCTLMIYDRLVDVGSILTTSTGNKTVNSAALPSGRYDTIANGLAEVEAWVEVTTATTVTAPTVNMVYTNELGTGSRTGTNLIFPAAATVVRWMGKLPLQAGDKGIKSVELLNIGVASTAGAVNIVLLKPIAYLPLIANIWNERDMVIQLAGLPRIYDTASLAIAQLATSGVATTIYGKLKMAYS